MVRKNIAVVRGAVLRTAQEQNFGFWHLLDHRGKHKSLGRRQKDLSLINHRDKLLPYIRVTFSRHLSADCMQRNDRRAPAAF